MKNRQKLINRARKQDENSKKCTGKSENIWSNQIRYEIHKICRERAKKYKDVITNGVFGIQFKKIS